MLITFYYINTICTIVREPLGRGAERQLSGALALRSNPLAEEETFFRQLSLVLLAILKALAQLGTGVSVIAPLPERLLGLIEGSL